MSTAPSRSDLARALAAYDDEALTALANKGLVRRAAKAVEAGKVKVVSISGEEAVVHADGETVTISVFGPGAAACTCPARGVCQHIVAATIYLRAIPSALPDDPSSGVATADAAAGDALTQVMAIDTDSLRKWTGLGALRVALELAGAAEVDVSPAVLIIRIGGLPDVRFLAGQGLDGVIVKCPASKRKAFIAAAVISVWRANGRAVADEDLIGSPSAGLAAQPGSDVAFLAEVQRTLTDAARTGLSSAPHPLEDRLFSLSISGRTDSLPRLAGQLRSLSADIGRARERHIAFDPKAFLTNVATAYALTVALTKSPECQELRGSLRRGYQNADDLVVLGYGAQAWHTGSGARGVTGFFYQPLSGAWLKASISRAGSSDAFFDPGEAYRNTVMWHCGPLAVLSKAQIELEHVQLASDRISQRVETTGRLLHMQHPAAGEELGGPSRVDRFETLSNVLKRRVTLTLAQPAAASGPVLIRPSIVEKPFFDDHAQEAILPVCDAEDRWLGLTVSATEDGAKRLDALEYHLHDTAIRDILAIAEQDDGRWRLTPYALIIERAQTFELINLDFDDIKAVKRRRSWWSYINDKDKPKRGFEAASRFRKLNPLSSSERTIEAARSEIVTVCQLGCWIGEGDQADTLASLRRRLEAAGLETLGRLLAPLQPGYAAPEAVLAAMYALSLARESAASLPYLQRMS